MSTITADFTMLSNVLKLDVSGTNWLIFHYRFKIAQGDDAATAAAATAEVIEWKKKEKEAHHYLIQKLEDSTLTELLCYPTVKHM
ncbi:hypothetical protein ARMGADRAFT_1091479 [Armillaria gallica]|uniref:Uncharacterized protein n=1 Tax=Armillaria gallica TaxID=47427 RepID=A0A2H3CRZ6_ARMGA|nr:hypothetical protein ARMGADRAFT_1091479 [Armillaria gallica]